MANEPLQQQKYSQRFSEVLFMVVAFGLWMVMFRGFISGKTALFDDAVSYYDHVKFYLDNIRHGVFPLWDPLWFCGSANNFFLQRMGCFNPFLLLTNVFCFLQVPYTTAYILYLGAYYFLGCIGFYLLAKQVLDDKICAMTAFLFLLFSSLGTRLFDSYLILMFTPIAWFFYFLVSFSREPRRHSFVGMILTLLIIFTTYIPFYFFLVLMTFLIFYGLFYGNTLPLLFQRYGRFVGRHKILVGICVVILLASMVPGYLFFDASKGNGEFVMPARNANLASVGSVLAVQRQDTNSSWSVIEEIFFARLYYSDMTQIKFAIFYVPLLAYVIFFLGFLARVDKKSLFFFVWAVGLVFICSPLASPAYAFLYQHVFFFKYFRNLHFMLWIALLPMFCLFIGRQLQSVMAWQPRSRASLWAGLFYLTMVHGMLAWRMSCGQYPLITTYLALSLSYGFFIWWLLGSLRQDGRVILCALLLVIVIEPLEVYAYLAKNSRPYYPYAYSYDYTDLKFHYTRFNNDIDMALNDSPEIPPTSERNPGKRFVQPMSSIYYASKWYSSLAGSIDYDILQKYRKHRFILYDNVEYLKDGRRNIRTLETALAENRNTAYVPTDDPQVVGSRSLARHSYYAQPLEGDSEIFKVIDYNVNDIVVKTDFPESKFLVYSDSYHTQWRVLIDGVPSQLLRADLAFKGVWVPAGKHTVEFKFGSRYLWIIYLFLFFVINGMFVITAILWRKDSRGQDAFKAAQ